MTIDLEIRAFVEDSERFYPADAATRSLAEQRRLYDAYAQAFAVSRPAGIAVEDAALATADGSIPLRRYFSPQTTSRGTIVYAHGGGFMLGSLDSHDGIVARLAEGTGADVVAVHYRLAPEHPAPAALADVMAVIQAVGRGTSPYGSVPSRPLILAGDSAGGTLMASAALQLAHRVPLTGLALIYPALGFEPAEPARSTEAHAPMLTLADVRFYRDQYLAGRQPDPWTFALEAPSLADLPPTFLLGAEHDPLRDDCTAFAARLREAGIEVHIESGQGLVHGFLRAIERSKAAARAWEKIVAFVVSRLTGSADQSQPGP